MKAADLKKLLKTVPNNYDVKILYGQSELAIVQTSVNVTGSELVAVVEEERDLSDAEKHG